MIRCQLVQCWTLVRDRMHLGVLTVPQPYVARSARPKPTTLSPYAAGSPPSAPPKHTCGPRRAPRQPREAALARLQLLRGLPKRPNAAPPCSTIEITPNSATEPTERSSRAVGAHDRYRAAPAAPRHDFRDLCPARLRRAWIGLRHRPLSARHADRPRAAPAAVRPRLEWSGQGRSALQGPEVARNARATASKGQEPSCYLSTSRRWIAKLPA